MTVMRIIAPARAKQDRAMPSAPMMPSFLGRIVSYVLLYLVIMVCLIVFRTVLMTWIFVHSVGKSLIYPLYRYGT